MIHWIMCRLGFSNQYIEFRGAWCYCECLTCGRRWADQVTGRMGPRDERWLATGEWTPPPGPEVLARFVAMVEELKRRGC